MNQSTPDAGIPLLTEIIPVSEEESGGIADEAARNAVPIDASSEDEADRESSPAPATAFAWERLEEALQARIVERLQAQIDGMLQDRIRDNLADMLQIATESISRELRHALHDSLSNVVGQAVEHEIAKLKGEK